MKKNDENISRRSFLNLSFLSNKQENQINPQKKEEPVYVEPSEIQTDNATFIPLYEDHGIGVALSEFPPLSDYCFCEFVTWNEGEEAFRNNDISTMNRNELIEIYDKKRNPLLKYLAKNNIKALFADIVTKVNQADAEMIINKENDLGLLMLGVSIPLSLSLSKDGLEQIIKLLHVKNTPSISEKSKSKNPIKLTRRSFLGRISALAATIAVSSWGLSSKYKEKNDGSLFRDNPDHKLTPQEKVIIRANAIKSIAHPELANIFLRNLIWVVKMIELSENNVNINESFSKQNIPFKNNDKLIIPMLIGHHHGAVEDMFKAGKEFCLKLISLMYTDNFLVSVADLNQGTYGVSSTTILSLPEDYQTVEDAEKSVINYHQSEELYSLFSKARKNSKRITYEPQ